MKNTSKTMSVHRVCFSIEPLDDFRLEIDAKISGVSRSEIIRRALKLKFSTLDSRLQKLEREHAAEQLAVAKLRKGAAWN